MYWSDIGNMTIASSYMNGTGQEIIATNVEVYGLAFDHLGKHSRIYKLTIAVAKQVLSIQQP